MNAKELYQSATNEFQQQQFKQGFKYLVEASKLKYQPAIKEVGICFLHGLGVESNLSKAIKYFKIAKTEAEAQFELSKLYYFGYGLDKSKKQAKKLLIAAAFKNFSPALNLLAVNYAINGKNKKAEILLSKSLKNKDRFAAHLLNCNYICEQHKCIDFIKRFKWSKTNNKLKINTLNKHPDIFTIKGLLSNIECEYIKFISSPYMRKSMTIDPDSGRAILDQIRTSNSSAIDWLLEDPAIHQIMKKCCHIFNVKTNQSEVLHVLHYSVGEEYKPHYDFFGGLHGNDNFDESDQRIKTICLYLNNVELGGETSFPKLDKIINPEKGTAVFFENINLETKQPYTDSLHAGQPIKVGEKWLATLWIRDQDTNRGPSYEKKQSNEK